MLKKPMPRNDTISGSPDVWKVGSHTTIDENRSSLVCAHPADFCEIRLGAHTDDDQNRIAHQLARPLVHRTLRSDYPLP